jgi:hypothetical protein|tara:strand:- start:124 stop:378 length:255 start_codon:yes stop_codon:yes gene_type:complete
MVSPAEHNAKLEIATRKFLKKQVGGKHYKDMVIQPIEFIHRNKLGWCEGNIVKYICRHEQKGQIEDLDKVIHYAELAKELYYDT